MSEDPNQIDPNEDLNGNEAPPTSGPANRGFILVVSILGGVFLLALVAMAVVVAIVLPRNRAQEATRIAQVYQENTQTVAAMTQRATLAYKNDTSTPAPPTATATNTAIIVTVKPSATSLIAVASNTPVPSSVLADARTATVAALLTQAAQAKLTTTVQPSSTALPSTGFVEDTSIPALLTMAALLVVVILLVRHLRASASA
jgi:hypothetical protein